MEDISILFTSYQQPVLSIFGDHRFSWSGERIGIGAQEILIGPGIVESYKVSLLRLSFDSSFYSERRSPV